MSLTDNEKASIIYAHIKNIEVNKYNVEISILAEQSVVPQNDSTVSVLNEKLEFFNTQITTLKNELDKLNITTDPSTLYANVDPNSPMLG